MISAYEEDRKKKECEKLKNILQRLNNISSFSGSLIMIIFEQKQIIKKIIKEKCLDKSEE